MQRAIAGRGRVCQAEARRGVPVARLFLAALALVIAPAAVAQSPPEVARLEAKRYAIDTTLGPERHTLQARADVTFRCGASTGSLELSLNPNLHIDLVRDSEGHQLSWARSTQAGSPRFAVQLEWPCQPGSTIQLHFEYAGILFPAPPFEGNLGFAFLRDDDLWYPEAGAFDFAESEMTLRVPAYSETLTSGNQVDHWREGKTMVYLWKTAHAENGRTVVVYSRPARAPVVQQVSLPAGPGATAATPQLMRVEEICTDKFSLPPDPRPCGELARRSVAILEKLSALLGPPPETSLTILPAAESGESDLGYSAPGMLVVNDWAARYAGASGNAPEFLPHEIAHQWFPNGVSPASASDGWLAESLAEYLAWRYLLEADPEAARVMVAEAMRDAVAYSPQRPLSAGLDLLGGPWSAARTTLYQRGMLVFRTLETAIDRERVDRVLPEFYKRYAGRSASIADFRSVCEEIAGRNLGWFFDYFIRGTEIPEIELRRLPSESPSVVAGEIVVKDFPPEGSVRVEMNVRTEQGNVEHSVATHGAVTPFTVNVPAPALGITLDPDQRILRWTEAAERLKIQSAILAALPDPIGPQDVPAAIDLYRRALAADPDNASLRAQCLHERLGELEFVHDEWDAAFADLNAAVNGHSLSISETYLCRGKAYVYRGYLHLRRGPRAEALDDARAGLALPEFVLRQHIPGITVTSPGDQQLLQSLKIIRNEAATH